MNYLSEMLKLPVVDADGKELGQVSDLGIATGEVFPRVTSLVFRSPEKTLFTISWERYVARVDDTGVRLTAPELDIRFSYLEPDEVLLARDILNKQIVDTQGLKVVRAGDLKLSITDDKQVRLIGAEVGLRGMLRRMPKPVAAVVERLMALTHQEVEEHVIAWSYMDLLERSTQQIRHSVAHKTLDELHPADIADVIEQLDPSLRAEVFSQLDTAQAAEAIAEFDDDELVAEVLGGMSDRDASRMLALMDPDDAAALIEEVGDERAEKLLRLMGVAEERAIRNLLSYEENTAGRIMTSEFVALPFTSTVEDAIAKIRELDEDFESIYYVYTLDPTGVLTGVLSIRTLIIAEREDRLSDISYRDVVYVTPDVDQEEVAKEMAKYNLVAVPVCDEERHILGIVTVDDALDVIAEEHEEDLQIAGLGTESVSGESTHSISWFSQRHYWIVVWAVVSGLIALALGRIGGIAGAFIYPMCAMPAALLAASRMVQFVKKYYLEYDEGDPEGSPYMPFVAQNIGVGLVIALLVHLTGQVVLAIAFPAEQPYPEGVMFTTCFSIAALVVLFNTASAVVYLKILLWRGKRDLGTSGVAMSIAAVLITAVVYAVATTCAMLSIAG